MSRVHVVVRNLIGLAADYHDCTKVRKRDVDALSGVLIAIDKYDVFVLVKTGHLPNLVGLLLALEVVGLEDATEKTNMNFNLLVLTLVVGVVRNRRAWR